MSTKKKLLEAAAGNAGEAVYVDDVFSTYLYTGNSSTQTITNNIDLAGEGGLVWLKSTNTTASHALFDTELGATNFLVTSVNYAFDSPGDLNAFNNDGFSLNLVNGHGNFNNYEYASWTFRKQPGFFDIVTYTGDGTTSRDINHNLGTAPGAIIIKRTDAISDWTFQHRYNNNYVQYLNSTAAQSNSGATLQFNSTNFKVVGPPSGLANDKCTNISGATYVAYLFAHDAQDFGTDSDEAIIKCGSFVPSSTWQSVIDIGFEPQWLMYKNASGSSDWIIVDAMRGVVSKGADSLLYPNKSDAEVTYITDIDFHPNGFEQTFSSVDTDEHIYVAIRRPHKPASEFAATDLFAVNSRANQMPAYVSGFPVDFSIRSDTSGGSNVVGSRLIQGKVLYTDTTAEEIIGSAMKYDYQDGWFNSPSEQPNQYSWMWRRAPGFFDVVAYTGTGSARTINHNLAAVPEMIWVKSRSNAENWQVGHKDLVGGWGAQLYLNIDLGQGASNPVWWNNTTPTSTVFSVGTQDMNNGNGFTYIAYLFASVAGISKVGSYTGTGNDLNVDCGFSAGARFVLVKRTDSTGDWYLWDSLRGIVAGNDPYMLLNTTAAQVTNTDYIDPLSSGFTITSSAPTALNASGGSYIFLAIA